jgi:hypothetical protein
VLVSYLRVFNSNTRREVFEVINLKEVGKEGERGERRKFELREFDGWRFI